MHRTAFTLRTLPSAAQQRARLRVWVVGVLLALAVLQVLVGSLGRIHQSVHGMALGHSHGSVLVDWHAVAEPLVPAVPQAQAQAHGHAPAAEASAASNWLAALFEGHHSRSDCEWFDRMALGGDGLLPAAFALGTSAEPQGRINWALHALLLSQSPALFWARAPPTQLG